MQVKSQTTDNRELNFNVTFDRNDLRLEYSLIGVVVHLKDCPTAGEPGAPAIPQCYLRIALPPGTKVSDVKTQTRETIPLTTEVLPVAPLQPTRPGVASQGGNGTMVYSRPVEEKEHYHNKRVDLRNQEPQLVEPFPLPFYTLPNEKLYAEAAQRPTARLQTVVDEGLTTVITVNINPVRITKDGLLEFTPQVDLIIHYDTATDQIDGRKLPAHVVSRSQAMRQIALTRRTVINPDLVIDYTDLYPIFNLLTDYLIITDNQIWDEHTIMPIGVVFGDVVASFERLAAWKRERGLSARVVTISNIVAGRYGNFRTNSRDLQEVIRKFLKMAQANWGVAFVLIGGDTNIVPVRKVAGGREGNINRQATNPPPDNTSFWTGTYLRMHVVSPGTWWDRDAANPLVRPDNGLLIPYDSTGASGPTSRGWYFTTDATYNTRTTTETNFVRVNGPAAEVNADLQFLYTWNTIPTDLYYASLIGPAYFGQHDWDVNNNGIYGQHNSASDLDGINYTPTVSVGRAPVRNATQADTFVNKVIAYEKFRRPDGTLLDNDWTKRVVLVSSNWGGRLFISATPDNPPGDNTYHHTSGQNFSVIKLQNVPDWSWSLLAYISETDVRLLPYRNDSGPAVRGWHFARSSTDLSPNVLNIALPSGTLISLPLPSAWIAVYGSADELVPTGYIFNSIEEDGSLADQEQLREQLSSEMPGFTDIKRLYEDIQDMTPAQLAAGPVEVISTTGLRDALNASPHIVSLSGHGNSDGCCDLSQSLADGLTNGYQTFIAYADSCLTNQFDGDAMSEHLLDNANGGAVAYIGNSRFSWISVGDDFQRRFFHEWSLLGGNAHLGLLHDTRASLVNNFYWADGRWAVLALNLMGDPEMPLWWREPFHFRIPEEVYLIDDIRWLVDPPPDPPFEIDQPYSKNWGLTFVHLRQGKQEARALADAGGLVQIPLTNFRSGPATVTFTRAGHQPIVERINIRKAKTMSAHRSGLGTIAFVAGMVLGLVAWAGRRK